MRKAFLLGFLVLADCTAERPFRAEHPQPTPVVGPATTSQIAGVVHHPDHQADLKRCYERSLKIAGHATNGRVDVTVVVGPSGSVEQVILKMHHRLDPIAPCIRGTITRWSFPANSEEYAANFPLVLRTR